MGDKNLSVLFMVIRMNGFVRKKLVTTLTGVDIFHILFPIYI